MTDDRVRLGRVARMLSFVPSSTVELSSIGIRSPSSEDIHMIEHGRILNTCLNT